MIMKNSPNSLILGDFYDHEEDTRAASLIEMSIREDASDKEILRRVRTFRSNYRRAKIKGDLLRVE
jgi:hypothetical protein